MTLLDYHPEIIFENKEYILVDHEAITTKEAYENGTISYAHLKPSGKILRFLKVIGTKDDITFTGEFVEASPDFDKFMDGLFGGSWPFNRWR